MDYTQKKRLKLDIPLSTQATLKGNGKELLQNVEAEISTTKNALVTLEEASALTREWLKENYELELEESTIESLLEVVDRKPEEKAIVKIKLADGLVIKADIQKPQIETEDEKIEEAITSIEKIVEPDSASSTDTPVGTGSKNLSRIQQTLQEKLPEVKKITNQTPINIFWLYIDSFFAHITEQDMKVLASKDIKEYLEIPPLGKSAENENEVGLVRRLIQSLAEEKIIIVEEEYSTLTTESRRTKDFDFVTRLKLQLEEVGLLTTEAPLLDENDEICAELRSLQKQLKFQSSLNESRKLKLKQKIKSEIANQEYYTLLDDVEQKIEGEYKKWRQLKKKKKSEEITSELQTLLDKREFLIKSFEGIIANRLDRVTKNLLHFEVENTPNLPLQVSASPKYFNIE